MTKKELKNIGNNIDNLMGVNQLFKSISQNDPRMNKKEGYLGCNPKDAIKPFNIKLPKHIHRQIKNLATDTERSINDLLLEAIINYYNIKDI